MRVSSLMHKIKITAIRKADYKDLQQKYENPIQHTCDIQEGQVFGIVNISSVPKHPKFI